MGGESCLVGSNPTLSAPARGANVPQYSSEGGMRDAHIAELAGKQFNRVSRAQLLGLGVSDKAIETRLAAGRLVAVEEGVYAIAPVLEHDDWGRWKAGL